MNGNRPSWHHSLSLHRPLTIARWTLWTLKIKRHQPDYQSKDVLALNIDDISTIIACEHSSLFLNSLPPLITWLTYHLYKIFTVEFNIYYLEPEVTYSVTISCMSGVWTQVQSYSHTVTNLMTSDTTKLKNTLDLDFNTNDLWIHLDLSLLAGKYMIPSF